MAQESLHAPWRIDYIRSLAKPDDGECFLCKAAEASTDTERRERLVLWQSEHCTCVMNRYPYTNGHLLVSPKAHVAEFDQLGDAELLDLQKQSARGVRLLRSAMSPQGFNIGINLGRGAGAGVPGHLHQHIVPRWVGDVNFMSVVGEVRIIPQAVELLYAELLTCLGTLDAS